MKFNAKFIITNKATTRECRPAINRQMLMELLEYTTTLLYLAKHCNYINLTALTTLPVEKLFGKLRINSKCDNTAIVAKEVIEKSLLLDALKANIGIDT